MAKRVMQKRSLVTLRDGFYHTNFRINGRRIRQSLRTSDKAQAEIIAAKIYSDALLGKLTGKLPELTLSLALSRYYSEHGQYLRAASDMLRWGEELQVGLGKKTLLSDLRAPELATYAARRRLGLANWSVKIELQHLRAVINRARDVSEVATPKIDWKKVMLEEAGQREHVLSYDEEERLFAALRPDYHALVQFALLTGARLDNVITLTWKQVDKRAGRIKFLVKSKKPGGDLHYVPITGRSPNCSPESAATISSGSSPTSANATGTTGTRASSRTRASAIRSPRTAGARNGTARSTRLGSAISGFTISATPRRPAHCAQSAI